MIAYQTASTPTYYHHAVFLDNDNHDAMSHSSTQLPALILFSQPMIDSTIPSMEASS